MKYREAKELIEDGYVFEEMFNIFRKGFNEKIALDIYYNIDYNWRQVIQPLMLAIELPKKQIDKVTDLIDDFAMMNTRDVYEDVEYAVDKIINWALEKTSRNELI